MSGVTTRAYERVRRLTSLADSVRVPERVRPSPAVVAGAAALILAAAAGWWLGGASRTPAPVVAADSVAAVGDLRLELEAGWVAAEAAPGPRVEGGQAFATIPGLSARAVLVSGAAVDATLVPAALRSELPERLPAPRRASLGGLPAWSYGPLRTKNLMLEVTVVPTTAGMLALTCSAPPASWNAASGCTEGVRSVTSAKVRALAPSADLAFRQAAGPVLEALDRRRVSERRSLSRLEQPSARAAAAGRLAAAHRTAAADLTPFAAPGATTALVTALRDTGAAYEGFAAAARRNERQQFIAARGDVRRAEAALAAALDRAR